MAPHQLPTNLNTNCNGTLYCVGEWAYNVTGGLFWTLAFLGFLVVLFISTQKFGTRRSFGFSSFVGILGALFLATLGFMPYWIASAFILTGVIGLASMVIGERG